MRIENSTRPVVLLAALLLLAPSAAQGGEAHLYVAPYFHASSLTGDGQISGGAGGTAFDLEDTLGIDPDERIVGGDAFFQFLGNRISVGYSQGEYGGRETLGSDLVFNGETFPSSERVTTEVDWKRYRLNYGFDFSLKVVNIGFLVGADVIDADMRIRSSSGLEEREDLRAPIPVVGVRLGVHPISQIAIHAEVSGFKATVSGIESTLLDGFVGLHYLFVPKVGLVAGYRHFRLEATDDDEDDRIDVTQSGPYAGLALHL